MKVREIIRLLEDDGWVLVVTRVSGQLGDDMPNGTFASVRRQAGLKRERP